MKPETCSVTGKKHEVDIKTTSVEVHSDGSIYIDVQCLDCGRKGCVGQVVVEDVDWFIN